MPNRITACGCSVPQSQRCAHEQARATARQADNDARRGSAAARGYDGKWARESKAWLVALGLPLCMCGCGKQADMVDHIRAPKGDMRLFWDRSNWQPYNGRCNRRKNIRSEGGFGR